MRLVRQGNAIKLSLQKDLVRAMKQGHAWLYSDSIESPPASSGTVAKVIGRRGEIVATGIYSPDHPIVVRICATEPPFELDDAWLIDRLERAIGLRQSFFDDSTTGYRLVAGEGDLIPGLVIDRYASTAVIKLDGGAPEAFYQAPQIANWLAEKLGLDFALLRPRGRGSSGTSLIGSLPRAPTPFLENGLQFTADVVHGQKTGFFLDQRDNRDLVRRLSKGRHVLNLFSYSGGFSIAAGVGGASSVTSVDIAPQAITACREHWTINGLDPDKHQTVVADCFEYLKDASAGDGKWDLVVCDPPSFAPSKQSRTAALSAYAKLAQLTSSIVQPGGLLALASCSSHVSPSDFEQANLQGIGRARRLAKLIVQRGLPIDHPTPLAMPELRYLKFQLFQLS